jgi:hypothetical protein
LCFDGEGNLFVVDSAVTEAKSSILKFTPDGKKSTVAKGISPDGMAFEGGLGAQRIPERIEP